MLMLFLPALFACGALAAQTLPDAPKPAQPGAPMSLEQAITDLRERAIATPSYAEWQKRKQREALEPRPQDGAPAGPGPRFGLGRDQDDPDARFSGLRYDSEDLAIHVLQPAQAVKLGVFYGDHDEKDGNRLISHDAQKGVRLTIQLGGEKKPEPVFHFPFSATYTETRLSGRRVVVHGDDFDKGFKELKP